MNLDDLLDMYAQRAAEEFVAANRETISSKRDARRAQAYEMIAIIAELRARAEQAAAQPDGHD